MVSIFKNRPKDVKGIRNAILHFIKEQLQKAEGGEGGNIRGLYLFVYCSDEERHLYELALYSSEEHRFKTEEVQKIADDFAIDLPENWTLEISFGGVVPAEAIKAQDLDIAFFISTRATLVTRKEATAYIKVLNGQTEKEAYTISSSGGKINIGREANVPTADGFYRRNYIAFTSVEANRSISRQHAHIEWDAESGSFFLYADEGGIPPYNKMKVCSEDGDPFKLQTTEIGYRLQGGDQIILGESATLLFTYSAT